MQVICLNSYLWYHSISNPNLPAAQIMTHRQIHKNAGNIASPKTYDENQKRQVE
jgi:hypothetical protein